MAETQEIEIARLGAQGDGVADTAAGPLYVPYALPGERVCVERDGTRTRLLEVPRPSPDRVPAPCRHFRSCGGCVAQHMSAETYRAWKRQIVGQALAHRGLECEVAETIVVAPGTRRRAVLEAHANGGAVTLGFHAAASHDLVDIAECPVLTPAIVAALPTLREIAAELGGETRLTVLDTATGLDVALETEARVGSAVVRARLSQIAARAGIARLTLAGDILVQRAVPVLNVGGVDVAPPPAAFVQAAREGEAAIAAIVGKATAKAKRVADLFCGVGTFSFVLARSARVLAVDSDRAAIEALKAAALHGQGLKPVEARQRDLLSEPLSRKELEGLDAVVLDPPRAGAKAQSEMLARSDVPVVVAVSCNPATLARDLRILVDGGYALESVTPIDQFVWSAHVEAVAVLRRPRQRR